MLSAEIKTHCFQKEKICQITTTYYSQIIKHIRYLEEIFVK